MITPARTILAMHDGSLGHRSQVDGLARAVAARTGLTVREWDLGSQVRSDDLALILCAGARADWWAAWLRWRRRVPTVCIMNPGGWLRPAFDLVVAPSHDGLTASDRVLITEGAMNPVHPATAADPAAALVLIGGPSRHHLWDDAGLIQRLEQVISASPGVRFTITTCRRTPAGTLPGLVALVGRHHERCALYPTEQTPRGWIEAQFQAHAIVWATQDSVSMVYEGLSAGARLGLIEVPLAGEPGRVPRGICTVAERGWAVWAADFLAGRPLPTEVPPLQEAERIAGLLVQRWPHLACR